MPHKADNARLLSLATTLNQMKAFATEASHLDTHYTVHYRTLFRTLLHMRYSWF